MALPIVAIVGTPNVGKSTIFNRIIGERLSIIHDERGVTRDRIYAKAEWLTRKFNVIDTGGIELGKSAFQEQIRAQVEIAIQEADVIVYVGDGPLGITADDREIANLLYRANKPVIVAVNKIDGQEHHYLIQDFYALGLGDPIAVSGAHGIGIGDLLDEIIKVLPEETIDFDEEVISFAIIGQPNVGKSSLVNAILNRERVIVTNIEGTTRDAIDTPFRRNNKDYVVIDTAGLKKRGKIYESVDKYAALRAFSAISKADIILFVIDAVAGIREQDKHVVGYAIEEKKAIIIVVNKWDALEKDDKTMKEFTDKVRKEFKFLDYAPVVFVSALTKLRIEQIFTQIDFVNDAYRRRVETNLLNEVIHRAQLYNDPPVFNGGRLKIYYANQVTTKPPTFVFFVNNPEFVHFSYERYLENQIRDAFDFSGTPLRFIFRERK
ncbi:MAG: ribosome biogenesis GTPase Der [Bacilli bacterium]|nr:ribosome biogenesis GTPase Der [Bacilli bacterium]